MRPQENGSKADVRWAAVGDASLQRGLLVNAHPALPPAPPEEAPACAGKAVATQPAASVVHALHVAAHHFDPQRDFGLDIRRLDGGAPRACAKADQRPRHGAHATLKATPRLTTLRVDCGAPGAACGVGGVDSWGAKPMAPHRPRLPPEGQSWAFRLRAFGAQGPAGGGGGVDGLDLGALARRPPEDFV